MILGAGIDIVEISRIERVLARQGERFLARVFTRAERRDCERRGRPAAQVALRFAVKEAGMKALGTGWAKGIGWHDFETVETATGLEVRLSGRARSLGETLGLRTTWLGTSLTRTHALAQVVLEGGAESGRE